ncbi:hypothetical protein PVAP13_8KG008721 [Panicum virgatum]|uniref:Uncharacterized protein n=1 Tax=Panicum virgatum TaxID=38727 RepID=A0A8T0PBU4_PANVG|nr:hypothetical protein PVAP13_8KG008721 [Panicum virgatum]
MVGRRSPESSPSPVLWLLAGRPRRAAAPPRPNPGGLAATAPARGCTDARRPAQPVPAPTRGGHGAQRTAQPAPARRAATTARGRPCPLACGGPGARPHAWPGGSRRGRGQAVPSSRLQVGMGPGGAAGLAARRGMGRWRRRCWAAAHGMGRRREWKRGRAQQAGKKK